MDWRGGGKASSTASWTSESIGGGERAGAARRERGAAACGWRGGCSAPGRRRDGVRVEGLGQRVGEEAWRRAGGVAGAARRGGRRPWTAARKEHDALEKDVVGLGGGQAGSGGWTAGGPNWCGSEGL